MTGSSVDPERDHERPGLRIVEVVDALRRYLGTAEVRLRIDAAVLRPRHEVATSKANIEAREAERSADPRVVERVAERDLAKLHVAAVLEELRGDIAETAAESRVP